MGKSPPKLDSLGFPGFASGLSEIKFTISFSFESTPNFSAEVCQLIRLDADCFRDTKRTSVETETLDSAPELWSDLQRCSFAAHVGQVP